MMMAVPRGCNLTEYLFLCVRSSCKVFPVCGLISECLMRFVISMSDYSVCACVCACVCVCVCVCVSAVRVCVCCACVRVRVCVCVCVCV